jgi:TM2 domain-containing membrane protein YozV
MTGEPGVAIYVHCPHCHEHVADMAEACPHCGKALPIGVVQALSAAFGAAPPQALFTGAGWAPTHVTHASPQTYVAHHGVWRPRLAAGLSVICGLGQFYNGQVVKGLVLLCGAAAIAAAVVFLQSSLAAIVAPLWWAYAIVDAYRMGRRG